MRQQILLTLLSLTLKLAPVYAKLTSDIVYTTSGPIRGLRSQTTSGHTVDVFYGIPFAKPPVGELRFQRPKPLDPWTDVKFTVTKPSACFQTTDTAFGRMLGVEMWNPNTDVSEDCLYLNVWVPRNFNEPPRAALVWIFGGGFWSGSSVLDVYDGSNLACKENVLVFGMNYRLGPLGFLFVDGSDARGNQGLLDQSLALRWIYENVVYFGGSADKITLFGESAGATSIGFHMLSPLSQTYFTRAIMQSGSPLVEWGITSKSTADMRSRNLADLMECPTNDIINMIKCLRMADAQNLTDHQWDMGHFWFSVPFPPIIDKYFLLDHPKVLLKSGYIKDIDVLLSVVKNEGMFWLLYAFPEYFPLSNSGTLTKTEFLTVLSELTYYAEEHVQKAVKFLYRDGLLFQDRQTYRRVADDMSGDELFKCPVVDFANLYSDVKPNSTLYICSYEYQLGTYPWPTWTGVMHGYEIEAVFSLPLVNWTYTQIDKQVANRVSSYWAQFAATG